MLFTGGFAVGLLYADDICYGLLFAALSLQVTRAPRRRDIGLVCHRRSRALTCFNERMHRRDTRRFTPRHSGKSGCLSRRRC